MLIPMLIPGAVQTDANGKTRTDGWLVSLNDGSETRINSVSVMESTLDLTLVYNG